MRTIRLFGLFTALGFVAGCPGPTPPPLEDVPGIESPTGEAFLDFAVELYGDVESLTPAQALTVLEEAVDAVSPGSHAQLNSASVALDKGDDDKAVGHLEGFIDKTAKERGKKVPEDDADFMTFVADAIIEEIVEGGGGG